MFRKIGSGILLIVMLLTFTGAAFADTFVVNTHSDEMYNYRYTVTVNYSGMSTYTSTSNVYSKKNTTNGVVNMKYSTAGNPSLSTNLGDRVVKSMLRNYPSAADLTGAAKPYNIAVNVVPGRSLTVKRTSFCKRWSWTHQTTVQRQLKPGGPWQDMTKSNSTSNVIFSVAKSYSYSIN